jgi:hypothetical protein
LPSTQTKAATALEKIVVVVRYLDIYFCHTPQVSHVDHSSSPHIPLLLHPDMRRHQLRLALRTLLALHVKNPALPLRDIGVALRKVRPQSIQGVFVDTLEVFRSHAAACWVADDDVAAAGIIRQAAVRENLLEDGPHDGDRGQGEAEGGLEHAPDQRVGHGVGDIRVGYCD